MSTPSMISGNNNNTNKNNNSNKTASPPQQQQCCTVCSAPTKLPPTSSTSSSGAARVVVVCSLRCSWQTKQQCVQCGRQVKDDKLPFPDHPNFKIFCGTLCLDEARRGNWCVACGCKQVTTQGLSRCSHECMSVDVPLPHESPFPSRRTTPGENESSNNGGSTYNNNNNNTTTNSQHQQQQQQQQQPLSRRASFSSTTSSSTTTTTTTAQSSQERRPNSRELQQQNRITCSPVKPGSKLWDRITTPFHRSGLQCFQVIQVHNTAADKKAYNAYRLSVDQNLSANGIKKYGFGGEGNEHKRFVPLMAGCGGHLYGLRLANQLPVAQHTCSTSNHKEIGCEVEGYPHICQSASCDVCRILEHGMKLTSVTGRTSHFSVPTLDAVLPWCQDASASTSNNNNINQQQQQKFQAAALIRTVLGNAHVVNDFDSVPEQAPPQGSDSVVCVEPNQNGDVSSASSAPRTDSAFNYNDRGVLCEYIVLFSS